MRSFQFFILLVLCAPAVFASERILFLGDSHVPGPFGKKLDEMIRADREHEVETAGVCGAVASSFTKGSSTKCGYFRRSRDGSMIDTLAGSAPRVQSLIPEFRPSLTFIELGANYHSWTDEGMIDDMKWLAQYVTTSGSRCVWVTMPDSRLYRDIQERLRSNIQQAVGQYCQVIDSTQLTKYPDVGGDGVHYEFKAGRPIAEAWAKSIFEMIFAHE